MEQHVFCIFFNYRGHHGKGVAIYKATYVNLQHKLGFHWKKMYFWTLQRVPSKKNSINWRYLCHEKKLCWPFQSRPLYAYLSTTPRCAVPFSPGDSSGGWIRTLELRISGLNQGILQGEVSLYHWPPVWLVWNQLYDNWQFLVLFAKQTNLNQSNWRSISMVQWYFHL